MREQLTRLKIFVDPVTVVVGGTVIRDLAATDERAQAILKERRLEHAVDGVGVSTAFAHDPWLVIGGAVLVAHQLEQTWDRSATWSVSKDPRSRDRHGTDDILAAIVLGTQEQVVFSRLAQVEFVSGFEAGGEDNSAGLEIGDRTADALAGHRAQAIKLAAHAVAVDLLKNTPHGELSRCHPLAFDGGRLVSVIVAAIRTIVIERVVRE